MAGRHLVRRGPLLGCRRWRWIALPALVALSSLVAGMAAAAWSSGAGFAGGRISAGELDLAVGEATWRQVTPGVVAPASGTLADGPSFGAVPGDVIEVREPVIATLRGDNLAAGFTVSFAGEPGQAVTDGRIAVGFHVEDAAGVQVAPVAGDAPFGVTLAVPGLVGSDTPTTSNWQVVVTVRVLGDEDWVAADGRQSSSWTVGGTQIRLVQVRSGEMYIDGGAS